MRVSTYGRARVTVEVALCRERKDENGTERHNNKGEREEDRIEPRDCIDPIIVQRLSPTAMSG